MVSLILDPSLELYMEMAVIEDPYRQKQVFPINNLVFIPLADMRVGVCPGTAL